MIYKKCQISRDVSLSKINVKLSLGGDEKKRGDAKRKKTEEREVRNIHFQRSARLYPPVVSEDDGESDARNVQVKQLDSAVYPAGVCSRMHALTRAYAKERRGCGVSLPLYDGIRFISVLRKASSSAFLSLRNIASSMPHHIRASRLSFVYDQSRYTAGAK